MSDDFEFAYMPVWELVTKIRGKKISPVELTDYFLARIEKHDAKVNAFLTVTGDLARAQAKDAEKAVMNGEELGPLHGVPVAIKDLVLTQGIRTTMGSQVYQNNIPDTDDLIVERLKQAGTVILGKTNTPEFGHRGTTENLLGDACRNPWDLSRTAGGSSGGAAAALIAALSPIAPGSDGGGSIRIPGAFCGVYGIKPTHGRIPRLYTSPGRWGQFSQNGPMTLNVRDAVLTFQVLAGPDQRDPTCLQDPAPNFSLGLQGGVKGLKIAWSKNYGYAPVDPEVANCVATAVKIFSDLGAEVEEIDPPINGEQIFETFKTIFWSDYASVYDKLLDSSSDRLSQEVRLGLEEVRSWNAGKIMNALHELEWHRERMKRFFGNIDLLLSPALAVPAFPIQEFPDEINGQSVDQMWGYTPFTFPINMSGQTAATVPCGFSSEGLPIGLHIVGPKGGEIQVIRASAAYEEARPWQHHRPIGFE